jgi:hypothetical protein
MTQDTDQSSNKDRILGYTVASGNPFHGVGLFGFYKTMEEAIDSDQFNNGTDSWVVPIHNN